MIDLLSVIYNSVPQCLNITTNRFKFILVDNHSTNGTIEKLRKFNSKNFTLISNPENLGFARAVNQGVRQALKNGADKVLLVNPDVKISSQQILNLSKTDVDIVAPILSFSRHSQKIYDFGGKVNWLLGRTNHIETQTPNKTQAEVIDYVSGACMLIDKRVFEKIGFFDERFFMYFEDVDFCLRAKKAGFKVIVDTNVIVSHPISEHKYHKNFNKTRYILQSNLKFILKWIPWYVQPVALLYWCWLFVWAWLVFFL